MTSRDEQETTVTFMRDDSVVRVYTSSVPDLRRLRKLTAVQDFVREIRGGTDWAEFEVRAENFRLFTAIRAKRAMSAEERQARGARLRQRRIETPLSTGS